MRRSIFSLLAIVATLLPSSVVFGATQQDAVVAPVSQLIKNVDIPYEEFTLDNGLKVIVHEDRKAPIVAVSIWYNVGSKDEPKGKTGFAHLFEHIMFNGSENAPGEYFELLREIGATDLNGTTWFDRTNYFQTVPKAALERILFLESDRMGYLLGAVTQETLTNQIGVVQNEKRQRDNQPYGLVPYAQLQGLFPPGHPYHHNTIGSMADLDSAALNDVKQWFRDKYGPNNTVLVLAGDISAAEARPLVDKYFGAIPRGAVNKPAEADVPTLAASKLEIMHDRVPNIRIYKNWAVPGLLHADAVPLDVGAGIFGGLASSRLDNELVRKDKTALRVSAGMSPFHRIGVFSIEVDVKPGVDPEKISGRIDQLLSELITNGPTQDEVQRFVTQEVGGRIRGLEQVGGASGKAVALAEGALYAKDPQFYKKLLGAYANVTPAGVQSVMQRWLTRPSLTIRVEPGERDAYEEAAAPADQADKKVAPARKIEVSVKRDPPPVGTIADFDFPEVQRATLSNGINLVYARRETIPVVHVAVEFDAGFAADPENASGTQAFMLSLLDEGTSTRNSAQIAEEKERLGAQIIASGSKDRTTISMSALTPNLDSSLELLADIIRNPSFEPGEVERLRAQQLNAIASEMSSPEDMAIRALLPVIYGSHHPYGRSGTGMGDKAVVERLSRDDLVRFHQSWIRPEYATVFAVGDVPLEQLISALEARFGNWTAPKVSKGRKLFDVPPAQEKSKILLIDRPQSPQSVILGGVVTSARGTDDLLPFTAANEVLGGSFIARVNMDLREKKGWSYGAFTWAGIAEHQIPFYLMAPVQADRTGDSLKALIQHVNDFTGEKGATARELLLVVNSNIRKLTGKFERSAAVLDELRTNALYRRPDDYWEKVPTRFRAMTSSDLDAAARKYIDPDRIVWVVVGDAAKVKPQVEGLGLLVEVIAPR